MCSLSVFFLVLIASIAGIAHVVGATKSPTEIKIESIEKGFLRIVKVDKGVNPEEVWEVPDAPQIRAALLVFMEQRQGLEHHIFISFLVSRMNHLHRPHYHFIGVSYDSLDSLQNFDIRWQFANNSTQSVLVHGYGRSVFLGWCDENKNMGPDVRDAIAKQLLTTGRDYINSCCVETPRTCRPLEVAEAHQHIKNLGAPISNNQAAFYLYAGSVKIDGDDWFVNWDITRKGAMHPFRGPQHDCNKTQSNCGCWYSSYGGSPDACGEYRVIYLF